MLLFYLPKAIKNKRPNVIIANVYDLPGMITAFLFSNIRLILDIRSSVVEKGNIGDLIKKILYQTSITLAKHFCDGLTVASSALKEEVCRDYGLDPAKVGVVTNGVSLEIFDCEKNIISSEQLKKRLKLSKRFIIFYHGAFEDKRGLMETIEAMAKIAPRHPEILFFMLGNGSIQYVNKLRSLIEEKHLECNVCIHGPVSQEEVPKFILMCDVGIAPLATYSFPRTSCPIKLLEYLAMERPVISTDIPFSKEILSYGKCGVLISSNKPENLAIAIKHMYENRASLKQMGKIGRAIIEKHYTWGEKVKDLLNFIGARSQRAVGKSEN
jgi:glycosyltransferase involved in cell wall biosynthesis